MFLERLSIQNYGVYAGRVDFDLTTNNEKPIILVGGYNGAGKTTILESIMIVLYGKTYFGINKTKKQYLKFIYDKLHRSNKKRVDSASVEIAFRFYHNGSEDQYVIKRSWTVDGASVSETFEVHKNGELLEDADESQWQTFIEGLIPIGIARLFFFDGEKIVNVAENKIQGNKEIKKSIETLIGAELVHRLHSDLNLYILRKSGSKNNTASKEYEKMNHERETLVEDLESLSQEIEKKTVEFNDVQTQINSKESEIAGIGGGYADLRTDLLTKRAVLEEKTRNQTKQLQDMLSEDAPFFLAPSLLQRVAKQYEKDCQIKYKTASNLSTITLLPQMKEAMEEPGFWNSGENGKSISSRVLEMVKKLGKIPEGKIVFDLNEEDAEFLRQMLKTVKDNSSHIIDSSHALADTREHLEKIESEIAKIPRDDEIGPKIAEINKMHQELGILQGEINHLKQQHASKSSYKKILQNRLKTVLNSIQSNKRSNTGVQLASKMQSVLDTYYANLKETKMRELEVNLLYTAKLLLHKESIRKIEIDRDSFEIRAYENEEDQIPGDFLSMGEKQIVGTALLWAIAKTCGRSLPFVIDTPLGRLDGLHLYNLVEKFYPYASHQIVLLSTDREIGVKEYSKLSKAISRSYRIVCDKAKSVTTVSPGYFMEEEIAQT